MALHNVTDCYIAENEKTGDEEIRITVDGKDLFLGTGSNSEGEPHSLEQSEEILNNDPNWTERVRVITKLSAKGNPYEMAILSDLKRTRSIKLG